MFYTPRNYYGNLYSWHILNIFQERVLMKRYARLDKKKQHKGLDATIIDVFGRCANVAPPALGSTQMGVGKL